MQSKTINVNTFKNAVANVTNNVTRAFAPAYAFAA